MSQTSNVALRGARLKIERARLHLGNLTAEHRAFLETKPYAIETFRNTVNQRPEYRLTRIDPVPSTLSLLAGDAVHCARSALDHLAFALYLKGAQSSSSGRHVYFPIANCDVTYNCQKASKTKGMSAAALYAIDQLKPYKKNGNQDYWLLNQLDNIDKHRQIVAVQGKYAAFDVSRLLMHAQKQMPPLRDEFENEIPWPEMEPIQVNLADRPPPPVGSVLFRDLPGKPFINMSFTFETVIEEPEVFAEKPRLIETISRLIQLAEDTVNQLEHLA